jgi:hypothetical protein
MSAGARAARFVIGLGGTLLVALSLAAAPTEAATCQRSGERVLASDRAVAVYYRETGAIYPVGRVYTGVVVCRLADKFRVHLDDSESRDSIYTVRVAGRFVAYVRSGIGTEGAPYELLNVLDSRPPDPVTYTKLQFEEMDCGCVPSLVLRPSGSIAYIARDPTTSGWYPPEVYTCEFSPCLHPAPGRVSKLRDKGSSIKPRSLRYHHGRVYWQHGRRERSAPLV